MLHVQELDHLFTQRQMGREGEKKAMNGQWKVETEQLQSTDGALPPAALPTGQHSVKGTSGAFGNNSNERI